MVKINPSQWFHLPVKLISSSYAETKATLTIQERYSKQKIVPQEDSHILFYILSTRNLGLSQHLQQHSVIPERCTLNRKKALEFRRNFAKLNASI